MRRSPRTYWVYIMSSPSGVLYIGVTSNLERRVAEHKAKATPGFTAEYNCTRLVYAESCTNVWNALTREKQLKGWRRERKCALVTEANPDWDDLAEAAFMPATSPLTPAAGTSGSRP